MTDLLLQIAASNVAVSLALAMVAWAVHLTGKRPLIAHLLWLLVLVKLLTPPIVTVPVIPVPDLETTTIGLLLTEVTGMSEDIDPGTGETDSNATTPSVVNNGKASLVLLWLFGSACLFAWSLLRVWRFNRLLGMACREAPPEMQRDADEIAERLGIKQTPTICTTSARISPMVWWIGGQVRILIPRALTLEMDAGQLRWILAQELAHVRRRDHLVRWLEWLACVCFWWNPVAWWARRNLRINEEICCDALVLSSFESKPRIYADALMAVVEYLASPVLRPPIMASVSTAADSWRDDSR